MTPPPFNDRREAAWVMLFTLILWCLLFAVLFGIWRLFDIIFTQPWGTFLYCFGGGWLYYWLNKDAAELDWMSDDD